MHTHSITPAVIYRFCFLYWYNSLLSDFVRDKSLRNFVIAADLALAKQQIWLHSSLNAAHMSLVVSASEYHQLEICHNACVASSRGNAVAASGCLHSLGSTSGLADQAMYSSTTPAAYNELSSV